MLASITNSSRMPSWHPPDSDSGMVQDDHNDANVCFFLDSAGLIRFEPVITLQRVA